MGGGMNVPGAHAVTGLELRRGRRRASEFSAHHDAFDIVDPELAVLERLRRLDGMSGSDVFGGDKALVDKQGFQPKEPLLVIRTAEIDVRPQHLPVKAR